MRIAGVDPGTIRTGVCVVETGANQPALIFSDVIEADSRKPVAERLLVIYYRLKAVFRDWRPDALALENIFFRRDFRAAVKVGEARAVAMLAATEYGVPVSEYAPARVKQAVSSSGRATKEQIQYMVRHLLEVREPIAADTADAIAIALCHIQMSQFERLKKGQAAHV